MVTSNTQRQQKARQIEQELQKELLSIYRKIKPQLTTSKDFQLIKNRYQREVYQTIRQRVEQVHALGVQYVGERLQVNTFTSEKDVALIKRETDTLSDLFWKRINKDVEREDQRLLATTLVNNPNLPEDSPLPNITVKPSFDTAFFVAGVATVAATTALALATKSKAQQVLEDEKQKAEQILNSPQPKEQTADQEKETKKEIKKSEKIQKAKIRWYTQLDERVCPICRPLHGEEWDVDDPDIPTPGFNYNNGTHFNCRCYLKLV